MHWSVGVEARAGSFDLNATIEGGGTPVLLIGPNGSGKTTLLRVIAGAYQPAGGRIRVGDRVLYDSGRGISLAPEKRRVGYVPQGYGLFPHLTVVENVAFGLAATRPKPSRTDRLATAEKVLAQIGCGHLSRRLPPNLSGGEKQRVALARALLPEPDLLLLDEPLAAMDTAARRRFRGYLARHLAERDVPAIVVTHDVRDLEALGQPTVYALEAGRVVQRGSPEELAARPATDFLSEFFSAPTSISS